MPGRLTLSALAAVLALLARSMPAQPPASAPPPHPCAAPEFHHFDFWIGDWDVTGPKGKLLGTNRVISILDGCAIQEHWVDTHQSRGESYTMYDAKRKTWHQSWVDDTGSLLVNEGGFHDGKLILTDSGMPAAGGPGHVTQRWTWTKVDADHVRQVAEGTKDNGKTWTVTFPGLYTRRRAGK